MTNRTDPIDDIDQQILAILARNPRLPYSDISDELAEDGHELSSEAIRHRVASLLEFTTSFFLLRPDTHDWEIVVVAVRTADELGAQDQVFRAMSEMDFWFVGRGLGTIDMYGVATARTNVDIDRLLNEVRGLELVDDVDYNVETRRATNLEKYFPAN